MRTPATTTMAPTPTTPAATTITPATTPVTTTPAITKPIKISKKLKGVTDDMVDVLMKAIGVSTEEGMTKTQLVKSIAHTIKEKWGHNDYWNVIVTSTLEGEEDNNVFGSFPVNLNEQKYLKLQLDDHLYCEIWKAYSRTPAIMTTTTITPATSTTPTTTTPTTTTTPVTATPAITREVKIIKKHGGVTDYMVNFLKKTVTDVVASAEEDVTKTQLAKSIAYAVKEKWSDNGSWNVIITSTPEGDEGDNVWGSFVNSVEHKYLKLHLGDHLYCEIWKSYSRTPAIMTTTTITPETTTTPTTTTTSVTTTPATTMQVKIIRKHAGVTDDMINFLKETIAVVVASAEEGTPKIKLARSIYNAINEKWNNSWNVIVASTPEGKEGNNVWGSMIAMVEKKYIQLQLGDKLYFEIWKATGRRS